MNMALALAVALAAPSCVGKDDEELFTQVEVTVCPPEGVVMERFQATMVFENVNTRQRTSTSDFTEGVLDIRLLRGLYRLSIAEGGGIVFKTYIGVPDAGCSAEWALAETRQTPD